MNSPPLGITRPRTLAMLAAVGLVFGFCALQVLEGLGGPGLPVPWTVVGVPLAAAALILWFAWPVRRWAAGHRDRPLNPHRAARTVVLAKAATVAAALMGGWYAGQAGWLLRSAAIEAFRDRAGVAGAAAAGFAVLMVAGLVAQVWCRRPPDDDEDVEPWPSRSPRGTLES